MARTAHTTPTPLRARAMRELRRLTNGLTTPPLAALPLEDGEQRRSLRLFEALFARDALRTAALLEDIHPTLELATVVRLAEAQGTAYDRNREEEPGRIAHELRDPRTDPVARELSREHGWDWPYYGAVDTTPLFVLAVARLWRRAGRPVLHTMYTDREGRLRTLEDAHRAALAWIFRRMDENRDGFVESRSPLPGGIRNQVWKDSADAYHHADGGLADPARGVSSVEVQALVHDALRESAAMLRDGISCDAVTWWLAVECEHRAAELAASFHRVFWVGGDRPYLALGADRDARGRARPLCVRTSNMGHVLGSGLLEGPDGRDRAAAIAEVLGSREMLAAGGVRTLARGEARYRAGGYHVGSVWPWENALIARGLRAASRDDQARDLERRVLATCRETGMFPEFVRGDACRIAVNTQIVDEVDPQLGEVRMEQPPQQVQAWTVAAALDADHRIAAEERRAA